MRPLHIGLLVVGAALAGGLAVKMTEPQPLPVAMNAPAAVAPVRTPAPAPPPQEVAPQPAKPTPMPDPPVSAPPPAYNEPAPRRAAIRINQPKSAPVPPAPVQPAAVQVAEVRTFPAPPYEPPPQPKAVILRPQRLRRHRRGHRWPFRRAALLCGPGRRSAVRIGESLSSDRNAGGDTFGASLADPLVVDGLVIAERGARVSGRVVNAQRAGRISGTSLIELDLAAVTTSDGQHVAISTAPWTKRGEGAALVGGGTALGAIISAGAWQLREPSPPPAENR